MTATPKADRLRVALYARTSSEGQERAETIENQRAWLRQQAELHGWAVAWFEEAGISGETLAARPQIRAMLEGVRAGRFDAVAVLAIDRLSRSQGLSDWAVIADTLKAAGVVIYHQGAPVDLREPTQALMFTVLGPAISGYEKSQILARTRAGSERALREGRKPRGVDPFGYRHDVREHRWEIVENEADTVRRVFALAVEGLSTWQIEERLRAEHRWASSGAAISRSAIHRMLRRRTYRGEWKHRGGTVPLPEIVDEDTWQRAQAGRQSPRLRPNRQNLLSGFLRCGTCGLPCHCVAVGKARHAYVRCASTHSWYRRDGRSACKASWRRRDVEAVVWALVTRLLGDASYLEACRPRKKDDPAAALRAEIEAAQQRAGAVEAKLRGATLRWSHGQMDDASYDVATGTLRGELALAKEREAQAARDLAALEALRGASREATTTLERYRARLASASLEQQRAVLAALCPSKDYGITLYPTRLVLRGMAPMTADKLGVPPSPKGGAIRLEPFAASAAVARPRRKLG